MSIVATGRIENSCHYIIDWNYDEDRSRIRTGYGPENITRLRRFAIGVIKSKKLAQRRTKNARADPQCPFGLRLSADDNKFMPRPCLRKENKFTVGNLRSWQSGLRRDKAGTPASNGLLAWTKETDRLWEEGGPELLQHAQLIIRFPLFGDLALRYAVDNDGRHGYRPAGSRNVGEVSGLHGSHSGAGHHLVAFSEQILY